MSGGISGATSSAGSAADDEALTALIERATASLEGVTPGPWTYSDVDSIAGGTLYDDPAGWTVASLFFQVPERDEAVERPVVEADANGYFIATARTLVPDLVAALGRLRDEAAALRAEVADLREPEITDADLGSILDLKLDGNGLDMRLKPSERLMRAVVGSLKATLDEAEAENYVEMRASDPESGFEYVMTVVRPGKPTPHTMRQRAEAERDNALRKWADESLARISAERGRQHALGRTDDARAERDAAQAEAAALRAELAHLRTRVVEAIVGCAVGQGFDGFPGANFYNEGVEAAMEAASTVFNARALAAGHQPAEADAEVWVDTPDDANYRAAYTWDSAGPAEAAAEGRTRQRHEHAPGEWFVGGRFQPNDHKDCAPAGAAADGICHEDGQAIYPGMRCEYDGYTHRHVPAGAAQDKGAEA